MEAKVSQKGIQESMCFWLGFGMALETLMGLRRGPRVGHFLQRIPQGGPRARGVIKQKQAKRDGLQDLTRPEPEARRIYPAVQLSRYALSRLRSFTSDPL